MLIYLCKGSMDTNVPTTTLGTKAFFCISKVLTKNARLKISSIFYLLTQNMRSAVSPCALTADGPIAKNRKGGSCPIYLYLRAGKGSRCTMGRRHWLQ